MIVEIQFCQSRIIRLQNTELSGMCNTQYYKGGYNVQYTKEWNVFESKREIMVVIIICTLLVATLSAHEPCY